MTITPSTTTTITPATTTTETATTTPCLNGWTLQENMCYKFISGIQQYSGAVSLCKQEGGSIVRVIICSFTKFYLIL